MTMIYRAGDFSRTGEWAPRLSTLLRRCCGAFQERRKRARLRASLYSLADRDLKDIGIAWSEIEHLALNGTDARVDPRRLAHSARKTSRR